MLLRFFQRKTPCMIFCLFSFFIKKDCVVLGTSNSDKFLVLCDVYKLLNSHNCCWSCVKIKICDCFSFCNRKFRCFLFTSNDKKPREKIDFFREKKFSWKIHCLIAPLSNKMSLSCHENNLNMKLLHWLDNFYSRCKVLFQHSNSPSLGIQLDHLHRHHHLTLEKFQG